jgi:surface protein
MQGMFNHAYQFNQNLNSWNVSKVQNMDYMFTRIKTYNQDLSSWNVSNVTSMKFMFEGIFTLSNRDFSKWNVTKVIEHEGFLANTGENNKVPNFLKRVTELNQTKL